MKSLPEQSHHLMSIVMVMAPFAVILRVNEVYRARQANYQGLERRRRSTKRRQSTNFPAC